MRNCCVIKQKRTTEEFTSSSLAVSLSTQSANKKKFKAVFPKSTSGLVFLLAFPAEIPRKTHRPGAKFSFDWFSILYWPFLCY